MPDSPVHLISLNIEGHKHLEERTFPFLKTRNPDILCLQEVFEADVPRFEQELGMKGEYIALSNVTETSIHQSHALGNWGMLLLSRLEQKNSGVEHYVGKPEEVPIFFKDGEPNSINRAVLWGTFIKDGKEYTVATTHFTWSTGGFFTDLQKKNMEDMMTKLDTLPPFVLCGDLNSPRQMEPHNVFNTLAKKYTDNIPADVTTSLDGEFHRAGQLELMVDCMFSCPEYQVSGVEVLRGVSDHCAVSAWVERVK